MNSKHRWTWVGVLAVAGALYGCSEQTTDQTSNSRAEQAPTALTGSAAATDAVAIEPLPAAVVATSTSGAPEPIGEPGPKRGPHGSHDPHGSLGPDSMIKVALQHYQEGRPGEALKTLDEAVERDERNADLRVVRGSLLLAQQQVARALEDLELAVKLRPDDAQIYINRAQAYRQFGREDEALADLGKAIELQPDLLAARFNRGAMLHARGDYAGALEDFDHCVALDPHTAAPYFNRASTYEALGRRPEAVADLERFLELVDNAQWKQTAERLLETWQKAPEPADAAVASGRDSS